MKMRFSDIISVSGFPKSYPQNIKKRKKHHYPPPSSPRWRHGRQRLGFLSLFKGPGEKGDNGERRSHHTRAFISDRS